MASEVITRVRFRNGNSGETITRFRMRNVGRQEIITRFRVKNVSGFSVSLATGSADSVNPFDAIDLTISPSQPADSVDISTVPQTAISGTGLDRSIRAPGTLFGTDLVVTVTAHKAGFADAVATKTFHVAAHGGFYRKNGQGAKLWNGLTASQPPPGPDPNAMPVVDYPALGVEPGWALKYSEDFLTPVALGSMANVTSGADLGKLAAGNPYVNSFKTKQENSLDTSHNAVYSTVRTTSVANSVLTIADAIYSGQACGGAVKPLLPAGQFVDANFFTIGVYIQWRAWYSEVVNTGAGFGGVWLAINDNAFPINGEFDVQEGKLGDTVKGNRHPAQATNVTIPVPGPPGMSTMDPHIWGMKWFNSGGTTPRTIWTCDGIPFLDTTDRVAGGAQQLGFLFQSGSDSAPVTVGSKGKINVDWITIHKAV